MLLLIAFLSPTMFSEAVPGVSTFIRYCAVIGNMCFQ